MRKPLGGSQLFLLSNKGALLEDRPEIPLPFRGQARYDSRNDPKRTQG
jgi:hypothetical protein